MRALLPILLLITFYVGAAHAAPVVPDSLDRVRLSRFQSEYFARSKPLIDAANFLGVLCLLDSLRTETGPSPRAEDFARQIEGTFDSFVGDERGALAAFRRVPPKRVAVDPTEWKGYAPEDAANAIVRLAGGRRLVLVNEAHHVPQHRALTQSLLEGLRERGFRYLALEALDENDSTLARRGYAIARTGFYTNEPAFGALIREALALGFTLVPYEATGDAMRKAETREAAEAAHIAERIFDRDPNAKVLVHAGYAHIAESGTVGGTTPLAVRLREATGIDPLTVDQVALSDRGDTLFDDPRRIALTTQFNLDAPFVLMRGDSAWSANPGMHDVSVITPTSPERSGRRRWLWRGRSPFAVPAKLAHGDCVVAARRRSDSADAVPVDALRLARGSRTLLLPPGDYVITARDAGGRLLGEMRTVSKVGILRAP